MRIRLRNTLTAITLGLSLWASPALADRQDLGPAMQAQMAAAIRAAGYTCDQVTMSRADRVVERGQQWQIDCNSSAFQYRVIVTPNDRLLVSPWH
jgi:hypothetical protein